MSADTKEPTDSNSIPSSSAPAAEPIASSLPTGSSTGPTISVTPATPASPTFDRAQIQAPGVVEGIESEETPVKPDTSSSSSPPGPSTSTSTSLPTQSPSTNMPTTTNSSKAAAPAKTTSVPTKPTTTSTSTPTAGPSTSTSKPKAKRKRSGFNKFLAAFGCLSAHDLEDEPKAKAKAETKDGAGRREKDSVAATPASTGGTTVPSATGAVAAKQADGVKDKEKERASEVSGGAGTKTDKAVRDEEKDKEVVVPNTEPTSPPLAETAGVTSAAVQPPGSGSELLHSTPSKQSIAASRQDSDSAIPSATAIGAAAGATGAVVGVGTVGVVTSAETLQHDESDRGHEVQQQHSVADEEEQDGDQVQLQQDEQGDEVEDQEYSLQDEYEEEDRLIAQGGLGIPIDENGNPAPLLPAIDKMHTGRKCLVLDLDETLLHSSFKMLSSADYIVPVEIESQVHNVYVIKRPGVDRFLTEMGKIYEIVVFTASLSKYADPVLDMLDPNGVVKHRLFRESCYNHKGNYVKDLSQLGRTMETCIIIDNSPASYIFHPNNAVPVSTWFNDPHDTELTDLCPFLADLSEVDDIRGVLDGSL